MSVLETLIKFFSGGNPNDASISVSNVSKAEKFVEDTLQMRNDYRSIKLYSLYHQFGYKRRGAKNTTAINQVLKENGLFCYPQLTGDLDFRKTDLRIYRFPVESLGELFESEFDLEQFVDERGLLKDLGIIRSNRQFRPDGSSSILDFFGQDKDGNMCVVELKHKDGDKRGVQQVMRYKNEFQYKHPSQRIRKILITGIRDIDTAKSVLDQKPEDLQDFEWYLYNYSKERDKLRFERVTNEFLIEGFSYQRKMMGEGKGYPW